MNYLYYPCLVVGIIIVTYIHIKRVKWLEKEYGIDDETEWDIWKDAFWKAVYYFVFVFIIGWSLLQLACFIIKYLWL